MQPKHRAKGREGSVCVGGGIVYASCTSTCTLVAIETVFQAIIYIFYKSSSGILGGGEHTYVIASLPLHKHTF